MTSYNKDYAVITKDYSQVNGDYCTIRANYCIINGDYCNVYGNNHQVNGDYCNIYGENVIVNGDYCNVNGKNCQIHGDFTNITGQNNNNNGFLTSTVVSPFISTTGNRLTTNSGFILSDHALSLESLTTNNSISSTQNFNGTFSNFGNFFANDSSSNVATQPAKQTEEKEKKDIKKILKNLRGSEEKATHDSEQCVICLDNKKVVLFRPCKHLVCCVKCAQSLSSKPVCPTCRKEITDAETIFS